MTTTLPARQAAPITFAELGVPAPIVSALRRLDRPTPFAIQAAALPDALAGHDVLGRARTGSGKTIAFAVPVVAHLSSSRGCRAAGRPRSLILAPTRELANQIHQTVQPLADTVGVRTATIVGGVPQGPQVRSLRNGADVCIATPGRLEDLIRQGHLRLDAVEVTVLDEADHLADLGFLPAVRRILDATPGDGQRLLFSATLDREVDVLVRRYLRDPRIHSVDDPMGSVPDVQHRLVTVPAEHKKAAVHDLLSGPGRVLAFTRTKHAARSLARRLTAAGIPSLDLHGNLSQNARTRNLDAFHRGHVRVLVATDIAARGIHVDDVSLVVHVDPPSEHKAYVHRSGRTGRAGNAGTVVTIATPEQRRAVRALLRAANVTAVEEHRGSSDRTGASRGPSRTPPPAAPGSRSGHHRRRRRARR